MSKLSIKRVTLICGFALVLIGIVAGFIDEYELGTYALVNGVAYLWFVDRWNYVAGWWSK